MKIVHICLAGPVTDGWNYQDNLLTKYHYKNGNDVTIITSKWVWSKNGCLEKIEKDKYVNEHGVFVYRLSIKGKDNIRRKFKMFNDLIETIKIEKPQILFIHNIAFLDILLIHRYVKRNKEIRVFIDNHSDFSNSATNWFSKNILHKIIWRSIATRIEPEVERFYGVLPARVDFLTNVYNLPEKKCKLLVLGADDEMVNKSKDDTHLSCYRKNNQIDPDDFLIVTGGKIDKWKRETITLMKTIKELNKRKIKLIVFGSVDKSLKASFNEYCGENVIYIGWINSEETYKYFEISDLVIFPGRHSIFWEQVVGQGKPMLCKFWEGTTHVNTNKNVKFLYEDNTEYYSNIILAMYKDVNGEFTNLKRQAKIASKLFRYSYISKESIEG